MSYEISKFGDAGLVKAGVTSNVVSNVSNFYGPRDHDVTAGVIKTEGGINELTIHIDAETLAKGVLALTAEPFIPAGSRVDKAFVEVSEAFVVGGTTPVLSVGTKATAATNGLKVTGAQLNAIGVYDVTASLVGTWAAASTGLVARTVVGLNKTAGMTSTGVGKAKVVVRYIHV